MLNDEDILIDELDLLHHMDDQASRLSGSFAMQKRYYEISKFNHEVRNLNEEEFEQVFISINGLMGHYLSKKSSSSKASQNKKVV